MDRERGFGVVRRFEVGYTLPTRGSAPVSQLPSPVSNEDCDAARRPSHEKNRAADDARQAVGPG